MAAVVGLACTACATVRPSTGSFPFIAVRYDVEPLIVREGRSAVIARIRRDLEHLAELGFNGVVFHHLDGSDRREVLGLAGETRLTAGFSAPLFQYYVTTGTLPADCPNLGALVRKVLSTGDAPAQPLVVVVDEGSGENSLGRGSAVCANVRRDGGKCLTLGGGTPSADPESLAVIDLGVKRSAPGDSPLELWLAQYHRGLLAGRTAGVVLNRYRRPPGDPLGLERQGGACEPARVTALRELLTRVELWGPRIYRHRARPIAGIVTDHLDIRIAALGRGGHWYLLAFNPSSETYVRGEVSLPETIDGRELFRAVEVPPSRAKPAGRVFNPRSGWIALPIALRPGDAALFELF